MKKLTMLFILLFACSGSTFAQSSETKTSTGKKIVMVGCVYEQGEKYLLIWVTRLVALARSTPKGFSSRSLVLSIFAKPDTPKDVMIGCDTCGGMDR